MNVKVRWNWRLVLCALGMVAWLGGCATTPEDERQSDIPWNTPQSWEGVVPMPGFQPSN